MKQRMVSNTFMYVFLYGLHKATNSAVMMMIMLLVKKGLQVEKLSTVSITFDKNSNTLAA